MSQQINLYEERLRPRHELATARNLGMGALFLLALMTAIAVWAGRAAQQATEAAALTQKQLSEEQEKLTVLAKQIAQRKISPGLAAELANAKAMLATRAEVMQVLDSGQLGNASGFSAFMSGFARQAQNDVWLTGFQIAAGGDEIEIHGRMLDPARLPAYVQHLSSEPIFQGRRFAALDMRDVNPNEQTSETSVSAASLETTVVPRLPRYVEFVLRSERSGASETTADWGGKK